MKTKLFLIMLFLMLLTGCGESLKEDELKNELLDSIEMEDINANYICTCSIENDNDNYNLAGKYAITLNDKKLVTNVKSIEIIESNNENVLNYYETYLNSNYRRISMYNGFIYEVKRENNHLITSVDIDYKEIDKEAFLTDYPDMAEYITKDKDFTEESIINYYKKNKINCKKNK